MKLRTRYSSLDFAINNEKQADQYQSITHRFPMVFGNNVYVPNPIIISHLFQTVNNDLISDRIHLISLGQLVNSDVGEIHEIDGNMYHHGVQIGLWSEIRYGATPQNSYVAPHNRVSRSVRIPHNGVVIPPTEIETQLGTFPVVESLGFRQTANGIWQQVILPDNDIEYATFITDIPTEFPGWATVRSETLLRNCCDFRSPIDCLVLSGKSHRRLIGAGQGTVDATQVAAFIADGATSLIDASTKTFYTLASGVPALNFDSFWYVYRISQANDLVRYCDIVNYLGSARSGGLNQQINPDILFDYRSFINSNIHADNEGLYINGVICSSLYHKPVEFRYFINTYAKWFDLIPYRQENRLGFYPATVGLQTIETLFTPVNQREYKRYWLDYTDHQINNIHVEYVAPTASDWIGVQSFSTLNDNDAYITDLYSSVPVQNDRLQLDIQLPRIIRSINEQSQCIEFYTNLTQLEMEIGDFIVVVDPSDTVSLSVMGSIRSQGLGQAGNLYPITFPFELDRSSATIDYENSYNYQSGVVLSAGDWVVNSTTKKYGQILNVTTNADGTNTVQIASVSYNISTDRWLVDNNNFLVNVGDIIITISLTVSNNLVMFYEELNDTLNLRAGTATLSIFPTVDALAYRVVTIIDNFTGVISDNSPYYHGNEPMIWRVSSIEPIESYLPTVQKDQSYLNDKRDSVVSHQKLSHKTKRADRESSTTREGYRYGYKVQATLSNLNFAVVGTKAVAQA